MGYPCTWCVVFLSYSEYALGIRRDLLEYMAGPMFSGGQADRVWEYDSGKRGV